jgi:hypothetical protein
MLGVHLALAGSFPTFSTPVTMLTTAFISLFLQVNKSLTSIDLSRNSIGDKGAVALGEGLAVRRL